MTVSSANIELLMNEYDCMLARRGVKNTGNQEEIDWHRVEGLLVAEGNWTGEGANAITTLVRKYGVFALRNALALAIVLKVEDGQAGL